MENTKIAEKVRQIITEQAYPYQVNMIAEIKI